MMRQALMTLTFALATGLGMSPAFSQTPPNTNQLQPAPDIPGVIKGGTMPEVVIKGLTSSDDAFWLPNVGVIFSEPRANRIVRLDEHDQPSLSSAICTARSEWSLTRRTAGWYRCRLIQGSPALASCGPQARKQS